MKKVVATIKSQLSNKYVLVFIVLAFLSIGYLYRSINTPSPNPSYMSYINEQNAKLEVTNAFPVGDQPISHSTIAIGITFNKQVPLESLIVEFSPKTDVFLDRSVNNPNTVNIRPKNPWKLNFKYNFVVYDSSKNKLYENHVTFIPPQRINESDEHPEGGI